MGCASSTDGSLEITLEQPEVAHDASPPELQHSTDGWEAFNQIEEDDERALQTADAIFAEVVSSMGVAMAVAEPVYQRTDLTSELASFQASHAEAGGAGGGLGDERWRELDQPDLTPQMATRAFEILLEPGCPSMPRQTVWRILLASIDRLQAVGPVEHLQAPGPTHRHIIVGDTHGQLQDVLCIFLTHGAPSPSNRYVFNGDIADRGPNSTEIFMLTLLFLLTSKDSVSRT
jgi:hypothetical protein